MQTNTSTTEDTHSGKNHPYTEASGKVGQTPFHEGDSPALKLAKLVLAPPITSSALCSLKSDSSSF